MASRAFPKISGQLFSVLTLMFVCAAAHAQVLTGEWVAESEKKIDAVRKVDLRVIVLGRDGKPVPHAQVHVRQLRHAFALGFVAADTDWPQDASEQAVWRCFNAVSFDRLADWAVLQPDGPLQWQAGALMQAIQQAHVHGWTMRWGGVISADAGRLPGWAASLEGSALRAALDDQVARVLNAGAQCANEYDLYTDTLDHSFVEERLGLAMLRRMYEQARATSPEARLAVRFSDALVGQRLQLLVRKVTDLRQAFIRINRIAIEQRIGGVLVQQPLARGLQMLGELQLQVVIAALEVGGASPTAAALNMETALRTLFADPHIIGIYIAGLQAGHLADPAAALFDDTGQPTPSGRVLDNLFHELWRTDQTLTTDDLGNVFTRVFAGTHHLSTSLADGTSIEMDVYVPPANEQGDGRLIILEPFASP
jgi:hypothetical protein